MELGERMQATKAAVAIAGPSSYGGGRSRSGHRPGIRLGVSYKSAPAGFTDWAR